MGYRLRLLRVDLDRRDYSVEEIDSGLTAKFIGGRGIAAKLLYDELERGIDPLGPENKLIVAAGPLTGQRLPSSGKLVLAAKSPSTLSYGDGNIGTRSAIQMRKAGFDVMVFEGAASDPLQVHVSDGEVQFKKRDDLWGQDTFYKEEKLSEELGEGAGRLVIGPGGENLVRYANVISQNGRAGGRTGMGAVMGSKNLAAITLKGSGDIPVRDEEKLRKLSTRAYQEIKEKEDYDFWIRQGTVQVVDWCQANSTLPTHNFQEGVFQAADDVDGYALEEHKSGRRGCPNCNMQCGNVMPDADGKEAELDYENLAMLGPNLGIGDLQEVAALNRLCDKYGLDTISTGSSIAFAMESAEKGIIDEDLSFGDYPAARRLLRDIVKRRGLGDQLAEGTKRAASSFGGGSSAWAMQIKGLEISAYDCHTLPGMALAYGTCSIGAHHKDSWLISWEVENDREGYGDGKIEELIAQQRKRGGAFEAFTTCRLPWIEVGFSLDWYEKFFRAVTGEERSWEDFDRVGDRIYSLIRSFSVEEAEERGQGWSKEEDVPPDRWFDDPLTKGNYKGGTLDREKYFDMLDRYYKRRGWDERGRPTRERIEELDLSIR